MRDTLHWVPYGDGKSGVTRYAMADDALHLQFHDNRVYVYDAARPGPAHLAEMLRLAKLGKGLSTYISRHVHSHYARHYLRSSGDPAS